MTWSFGWLVADEAGVGVATGVWIAGAGTVELEESSFERYPKIESTSFRSAIARTRPVSMASLTAL
jgi:hypothetical protein